MLRFVLVVFLCPMSEAGYMVVVPNRSVFQDPCALSGGCDVARWNVREKALASLDGPAESEKCVMAHRWGLGSELSGIVKSVVNVILNAPSERFCVGYDSLWSYAAVTRNFERNCSKLGCFFEALKRPCASDRSDCIKGNPLVVTDDDHVAKYERQTNLSLLSVRAAATKAIFQTQTKLQRDHFQKKARDLFQGNFHTDYIAVHIRWGDKLTFKESEKVEALEYIKAAENLAAQRNVTTILIVTNDHTAADAVKDAIGDLPTSGRHNNNHTDHCFRYVFPSYYASAKDPLDFISDIMLLTAGKGAVVTFSSNMGRLVYFLRHDSILNDTFNIVSMDWQTFHVNF